MGSLNGSTRRVPVRTALLLVAISVLVAVPTAVLAAHVFADVPDSNTFHDDIAWLADNEVTLGCVPDGSLYCPTEAVTRQQMAGFMRRLSATSGVAGFQVEDFDDEVDITSDAFVELASITIDAKAASDVVLTAHGYLEKPESISYRYELIIARDGCDGEVVGATYHRPPDTTDMGFTAFTISLTGFDSGVSGSGDYVFCARKTEGGPDVTINQRGLIATWHPQP
jgi:hypothetical protein